MPSHSREARRRVFLAERYWPGLDQATARRASLDFVGQLQLLGSDGAAAVSCTFVPTEESVLCVVRAGSAGLVADAGRRAGLAFDRIVEVEALGDPALCAKPVGRDRTSRSRAG